VIGLISGTGTEGWPGLEHRRTELCHTRFGPVELTIGKLCNRDVAHVSRHGPGHARLSNHVDHRANLAALIDNGVEAVFSVSVCGALDPTLQLGSLVVFDDLYFPSNRLTDGTLCTWHEKEGVPGRGHWIFEAPFSESLRDALITAAGELAYPYVPMGCYGHVDGPRFNSRSEVRSLRSAGVSAISQTAGPETVLAGEAGLPFALVGYLTDYANGVVGQSEPVPALKERIRQSTTVLTTLVSRAIGLLGAQAPTRAGTVYSFD